MDIDNSNNEMNQQSKERSIFKDLPFMPLLIVTSVIFIFLGVIAGWAITNANKPKEVNQTQVIREIPVDFVLPSEMLNDPIYTEWGANIKGRVSSINSASFTVTPVIERFSPNGTRSIEDVKNGQPLTIQINDKTEFRDDKSEPFTVKKTINFSSLKLGDIVEGWTWIVSGDKFVGTTFSVR